MQRPIEGRDDGLFYFRSAEAVARADDFEEIQLYGVLLPEPQVDLPDGLALVIVRQVDEKDFVEAPFTKEFRGKGR